MTMPNRQRESLHSRCPSHRKENMMKNKSTNYLLPVHLSEAMLEIDGTTFLVESRYLGEDSIFRLLGKLMLDDLEPDDYTPDGGNENAAD